MWVVNLLKQLIQFPPILLKDLAGITKKIKLSFIITAELQKLPKKNKLPDKFNPAYAGQN